MALMQDPLLDAQLVRALASTADGGAELGECLGTADRITAVDEDLWFREWSATAERAEADAAAAVASGTPVDARLAWFRACTYHRTASLLVMGLDGDDRFRHSVRRASAAFRQGAALLDLPPDVVSIPYEGTTLPGYFFRAADDGLPRPTMILTNGYDSIVEELYFSAAAAALARGFHVLAFDGPGQGSVVAEQGLPFRPDWEAVVTPVVDFALGLPEVDPAGLVLHGWSFGGYLAPRAATGEHRLAACISDSGPYDLWEASLAKLPGALADRLRAGDEGAKEAVVEAMSGVLTQPTAGWSLRRNLYVHGASGLAAFLDLCPDYTLRGREHLITCPTFICATEGDELGALAPTLAAALTCPTELVTFAAADDVTGHCEMSNRAAFHRRVFGWLQGVLDARS